MVLTKIVYKAKIKRARSPHKGYLVSLSGGIGLFRVPETVIGRVLAYEEKLDDGGVDYRRIDGAIYRMTNLDRMELIFRDKEVFDRFSENLYKYSNSRIVVS